MEDTAMSFLSLWGDQQATGQGSWPALLLNATWVQTGRRLIASNLDLARRDPETPPDQQPGDCRGIIRTRADGRLLCVENGAFEIAHDQLAQLGRDLPLSTAADNSARFPYVSPAGTMRRAANDRIFARLVDGGYFENFGAVTALEVLKEAVAVMQTTGQGLRDVQIVAIQISSDPSLPDPPFDVDDRPLAIAPEIRAPLTTFFATRTARGVVALASLQDWIENLTDENGEHVGRFFHFRMCDEPGMARPPLGWALSDVAQERIQNYIAEVGGRPPACADNVEALERILKEVFPREG